MERRHLAAVLRLYRLRREMSTKSLARRLGKGVNKQFSAEYIENIEDGRSHLSNELFTDMCRCLRVIPERVVRTAKRLAVLERIPGPLVRSMPPVSERRQGISRKLRKKTMARRKRNRPPDSSD